MPRAPPGVPTKAAALHGVADAFLRTCVLPRLTLSSADAVFCFEFVKRMQALETPGWSAILFYVSCMLFVVCCVLWRHVLFSYVKRMQALETPGWSAILFYVSLVVARGGHSCLQLVGKCRL